MLGSKSEHAESFIEMEIEELLEQCPELFVLDGVDRTKEAQDLVDIFRGRLNVMDISIERLNALSRYLCELSNHQSEISVERSLDVEERAAARHASKGLETMMVYTSRLSDSKVIKAQLERDSLEEG